MPLPTLSLIRAMVVAGQGGLADPPPGPGPWDARAWAGAALYVLLFLAALAGILALLKDPRTDPAGPGIPAGGDSR